MVASPSPDSAVLQTWLDRCNSGSDGAREELVSRACERLRVLTRRMLRRYPHVRRWEQADDVLQNALIRLHRALGTARLETVRQFMGLATTVIRSELIDLARHHYGPEGHGSLHDTDAIRWEGTSADRPRHEPADDTGEPSSLAEWTEFHERVKELPREEREVFGLLFYEGLTQAEAAKLLGVSERTVKRRWQSARLLLYQQLRRERSWPVLAAVADQPPRPAARATRGVLKAAN